MVSVKQIGLIKFIFLSALVCAIFFTACSHENKTENFYLNLNDTVDYVGKEKCRMCHEDHYNTFIHTGMGSSFSTADKIHSKANFHQKPVYDKRRDMYYVMWWDGEMMKLTEFRLKWNDTIHKRTETIKYIIGSGQHTNSHFWESNGYLFQAPLTYYTQKGIWDLPPGYEATNTGFSRKIDFECMSCHNAMPEIEKGSVNKFTKIPLGIDCERCHGPGEMHVNNKLKGILVDVKKDADRSIVNPAKLPWKLQVDICQRCHLQGNNVLKPGKKFSDFKPGMPLSEVFDIFMPRDGETEFFMAGHAERLQMSACFIQSNKGNGDVYNSKMNFTCITCHNPHVSVKETNIDKFNSACKNCHNPKGNSSLKKCSENQHKIDDFKNNCVRCHMPGNGTEDIPHVTVHDHYIRKNYSSNQKSNSENKFKLYAVNDPDPGENISAEGYISWFEKFSPEKEYLQQARKIIENGNAEIETEIHFLYSNSAWKEMIEKTGKIDAEKTDAWTCYRIAKAFDKTGESSDAATWYFRALQLMPGNPDFALEYGNALLRYNRLTEAENVLKKLVQAHPKNEKGLANLGAVMFARNNVAEALKYLNRSVVLNPDIEASWLYLSEVYLKTENKSEAKKCLENALRLRPDNEKAKEILKTLGG